METMNWNNINFTGNEVAKFCVQLVAATAFTVMIKTELSDVVKGIGEMKQDIKEDRDRQRSWQAKVEAEYGEIKVRVAILEQKVTNLEIQKDANK